MKKRKTFEIKFYEGLLQKLPNFIEVLVSLGDAYTSRGFYHEGLEIDKRLVKLKPEDPVIHYNLACSFSLTGDYEQALSELKKAVLLGYNDFPHMIKDPDLENLRKEPIFENFLQEVRKKMKK